MKEKIISFFRDLWVQVLGGILVAIIMSLGIFKPKVFQVIWQRIITAWGYLSTPVSLPIWLVGIITLYTFVNLLLKVLAQRATGEVRWLSEYKKDYIFGLVWNWSYITENKIPSRDLYPFCPVCSTRLVPKSPQGFGSKYTDFYCETCKENIKRLESTFIPIRKRVGRQIERKIKTGEWKEVVKRTKEGKLIPKENDKPPSQ